MCMSGQNLISIWKLQPLAKAETRPKTTPKLLLWQSHDTSQNSHILLKLGPKVKQKQSAPMVDLQFSFVGSRQSF